jgi:hypothetical protein
MDFLVVHSMLAWRLEIDLFLSNVQGEPNITYHLLCVLPI